jgi:predicted TIM-barrel fold metal-dependent hydrolase
MTATAEPEITVIDCDSHLIEPPDLWTSRVSAKYHDDVPHVVYDEKTQRRMWHLGKYTLGSESDGGHAGWEESYPSLPPSFDRLDPACWEPNARLQRMDEHGIDVQLLFPNVLGFQVYAFQRGFADTKLQLECIRAYNDFQTEFCSVDPTRLIPQMFLPFWDIDATIAEMKRCYEMGHKSVLFSARLEQLGLPRFRDHHWDPIYSLAQEMDLPITFHLGFSTATEEVMEQAMAITDMRDFTIHVSMFMLGNAGDIAEVVMSGLCDRFPTLKFASIESGYGYIPYLMQSLDWQFLNMGGRRQHPESLMPSEYFKRQVYTSFWFEQHIDRLIDFYPDNVMFSSDFPHPTSLSPGPGSYAQNAKETIQANLMNIPYETRKKVLHDTAKRVYKLP